MEKKEEFEIGRICEKTDGKEKGRICVIVDKIDETFVMIDGNVKRRKCNMSHLKPLEKVIRIKKNENAEKVREEMKKEGFEITRKVKVKERLRVQREIKKEKENNKNGKGSAEKGH